MVNTGWLILHHWCDSHTIGHFAVPCWWGRVWTCKLGVILVSQERLKIKVKLLLSAKSHICHFDWLNSNGRFTVSQYCPFVRGSGQSPADGRNLLNFWLKRGWSSDESNFTCIFMKNTCKFSLYGLFQTIYYDSAIVEFSDFGGVDWTSPQRECHFH